MIAAGFAVTWAGYTLGVWGYCLIKSYNVTFGQLFKTTWPGGTDVVGGSLGSVKQIAGA